MKRNGKGRYKYLVLGRDKCYFAKQHSDSTKRFSETDIINMLDILIENIFIMLGGRFFNRESANLWVQTWLLFSLTCSFIRMKHISYNGFSRKTTEASPIL
jgi:hypothetical protein